MRAASVKALGPAPWRWRCKAWAEGARQSWEGFFRRTLPQDEAHVFAGLTLGFKGPLRRDWNRAVQDAGAMHLLVPSGAKVALVILSVVYLATMLGLRPWKRFALAILVGGFYTLMVGAEAPYTRAFWAACALGSCRLSGRDSGAFQAMTLAALLTLLWDPREIFSVGFHMTYAAVFGLVVAVPRVNEAVPKAWPGWLRYAALVAVISVLVQVMLWPIFANVFARGSFVGALANMLLVPASGILMALGFGAWTCSALFPAAGPFLGWTLGLAARLFVGVCQSFAGLPMAAADLSPMSSTAVATYYLLVFALLILPRWRVALALAGAAVMLWSGTALAGRWSAPDARVLLLRLPPAYPAVISFADGRTWLVDPGTKVAAVLKVLRSRGVKSLDRVVLTRPLPGRAWRRLRAGIAVREAAWLKAPWRYCPGEVCFEFGGPGGPRVRKGDAEYCIIPSRLKLRAVEVAADGARAEVR